MSVKIRMEGTRWGRLTVIDEALSPPKGQTRWNCVCDCGKTKIVVGYSLRKGMTNSCGCLQKQRAIEASLKHGHARVKNISPTYSTWESMMRRCYGKDYCRDYKNYGGRGIEVCERWHNFQNFLEDMGERPEGLQIDRIDNASGYYKDNCRWVSAKQNNRNRRSNHFLEYNGQTLSVAEWAEITGMPQDRILQRINKLKWDVERALTTP